MIDKFGCLGNTIKVAAGWYVDLQDPEPVTLDIESIASALSKICRFGGHCPQFYSVAEHCFHATGIAAKDKIGGAALRAILLHDATEAYLGDMVKPLKQIMPQYSVLEAKMEAAVAERFNVDFERYADIVKHYDRLMLKAEKQSMWPQDSEQWSGFAEIGNVDIDFRFSSPNDARIDFLAMAKTLEIT